MIENCLKKCLVSLKTFYPLRSSSVYAKFAVIFCRFASSLAIDSPGCCLAYLANSHPFRRPCVVTHRRCDSRGPSFVCLPVVCLDLVLVFARASSQCIIEMQIPREMGWLQHQQHQKYGKYKRRWQGPKCKCTYYIFVCFVWGQGLANPKPKPMMQLPTMGHLARGLHKRRPDPMMSGIGRQKKGLSRKVNERDSLAPLIKCFSSDHLPSCP